MNTVSAKQLDRNFWSKVLKTETCWVWQGNPSTKGYGRCTLGGRRIYAHRASFELHKGEIPAGLDIDHMCHNTMCVNPDHLQVATRKENKENCKGAYACNKSGVRGVNWSKHHKRWRAQMTHNSKNLTLGYFDSIEEAEEVVIAMRNKLFTNNLLDRVA